MDANTGDINSVTRKKDSLYEKHVEKTIDPKSLEVNHADLLPPPPTIDLPSLSKSEESTITPPVKPEDIPFTDAEQREWEEMEI